MAKLKVNQNHPQNYRVPGTKMVMSYRNAMNITPQELALVDFKGDYIREFGRNAWNVIYRQPARHAKKRWLSK